MALPTIIPSIFLLFNSLAFLISSIDDIKKARELNNNNIEGIIVGKAIYDGDIKLEELVRELDA